MNFSILKGLLGRFRKKELPMVNNLEFPLDIPASPAESFTGPIVLTPQPERIKDHKDLPELDWDIEWTTGTEALYTSSTSFCFVSKDRKQCHPLVTCKDYLGDMVFGTINDWEVTQTNGNFKYSTKNCPRICVDELRLVLCNRQDAGFSKSIGSIIDLIHKAEKELNIPWTQVFRVRNPKPTHKATGMFLFVGDAAWMSSPVMLSLYTLLLRMGKHHSSKKSFMKSMKAFAKFTNDTGSRPTGMNYYDPCICRDSIPAIERMIAEGYENVFGNDLKKNYPPDLREDITHSGFGIQSFALKSSKKYCPHWYLPKN
jgi:hypothetical protein